MTDFPQLASYDLNASASVANIRTNGELIAHVLGMLTTNCHAASYNRGWWHDPITGTSLIPNAESLFGEESIDTLDAMRKAWFPFVVGAKLNLIHDEVSEGSEAFRMSKMDDKITAFAGITAEMVDAVIRIADLMGMMQYAAAEGILIDLGPEAYRFTETFDLGGAYLAKTPFNAARPDHDLAKREENWGKGGKLY